MICLIDLEAVMAILWLLLFYWNLFLRILRDFITKKKLIEIADYNLKKYIFEDKCRKIVVNI